MNLSTCRFENSKEGTARVYLAGLSLTVVFKICHLPLTSCGLGIAALVMYVWYIVAECLCIAWSMYLWKPQQFFSQLEAKDVAST